MLDFTAALQGGGAFPHFDAVDIVRLALERGAESYPGDWPDGALGVLRAAVREVRARLTRLAALAPGLASESPEFACLETRLGCAQTVAAERTEAA